MHTQARVERPFGPSHPFTVALCEELGAGHANISDEKIARFCSQRSQEVTAECIRRIKMGLQRPSRHVMKQLRGLCTRLQLVPIEGEPAPTPQDLARAREKAEWKDSYRNTERHEWRGTTPNKPPRTFGSALAFFRTQAGFVPQDIVYWLNGQLPWGTDLQTAKYLTWERGSTDIPREVRYLLLEFFDELDAAIDADRVDYCWDDNADDEPKERVTPIMATTSSSSSRFNSPRLVAPKKVKAATPAKPVKPVEAEEPAPTPAPTPAPAPRPGPVITVVPRPATVLVAPAPSLEDLALRYAVSMREEKVAIAARKAAELVLQEAQAAVEVAQAALADAARHAAEATAKREADHKALEDAPIIPAGKAT